MCPQNHRPVGNRLSVTARKGNVVLRAALIEAARSASSLKDSDYAAQYRWFCCRFGKRSQSKTIFFVAHSMPVSIWHMLASESDKVEFWAYWYDRRSDNERHARRLAHQIACFGYKGTVEPGAA